MGRFVRFIGLVGLVVLSVLGTRPAAASVRDRAGFTSSAEIGCYVTALVEVFDGGQDCR